MDNPCPTDSYLLCVIVKILVITHFALTVIFTHQILASVTNIIGSWLLYFGRLIYNANKSGRILGQEGVNTEICEQVNSFLQCIKYTGSHLSQDHFTFFLQFFLYLMNKDKTRNLQKLAGIAIGGQL